MEIIIANKDNLSSVLMGKNLPFAWRGQKGVMITVSYNEWYKFIEEYKPLLSLRKPLDYNKMFSRNDADLCTRYFWFEMSWAQYAELAHSSNMGKDATLIIPYFENGKPIDMMDVLKEVKTMGFDTMMKYHNSLIAATRNYYNLASMSDISYGVVELSNLSQWNQLVFYLCIYLQSKSSNKNITERLNIQFGG